MSDQTKTEPFTKQKLVKIDVKRVRGQVSLLRQVRKWVPDYRFEFRRTCFEDRPGNVDRLELLRADVRFRSPPSGHALATRILGRP